MIYKAFLWVWGKHQFLEPPVNRLLGAIEGRRLQLHCSTGSLYVLEYIWQVGIAIVVTPKCYNCIHEPVCAFQIRTCLVCYGQTQGG